MSRFPVLRHPRFGLLALVLGVGAAMLVLMAPLPAAAAMCPIGDLQSRNTFYYSGPDLKKQVGECFGCSGACTGKQTAYFFWVPACCSAD